MARAEAGIRRGGANPAGRRLACHDLSMSTPAITPALPWTRRLFRIAGIATVAAVTQLYLFPGDTARFFAWTLQPPISAALMGAGFGAGVVLVLGMWGKTEWAMFRLSFAAVFVFSVVTLAASLIHVDRMHFGDGGAGEVAAWIWLIVYLALPILMPVLWILQRRVGGSDPPVVDPIPEWLKVCLGVIGIATVATGVVLFVAPEKVAEAWPWALTPFASRAIAAWFIGLGTAALLAIREGDLARLHVPGLAYLVFGGLSLVALLRFRVEVDWSRASAWVLVLWLLVLCALGTYAELRPRRRL